MTAVCVMCATAAAAAAKATGALNVKGFRACDGDSKRVYLSRLCVELQERVVLGGNGEEFVKFGVVFGNLTATQQCTRKKNMSEADARTTVQPKTKTSMGIRKE